MSTLGFGIFSLFTLVLVLGYFVGKKRNLTIIRNTAKTLEETFLPTDKLYTWIGGLIGFKGEYKLEDFTKLYITCTLLPRQSFLYYPVSLFVSKFDKLIIEFLSEDMEGEWFEIIHRRFPHREEKLAATLRDYKLYGNYEVAMDIINREKVNKVLLYLGLERSNKRLKVVLIPSRDNFREILSAVFSLYKSMLKTR